MKRILSVLFVVFAAASAASAQYVGPGYNPGGGGSSTPTFPLVAPALNQDCSALATSIPFKFETDANNYSGLCSYYNPSPTRMPALYSLSTSNRESVLFVDASGVNTYGASLGMRWQDGANLALSMYGFSSGEWIIQASDSTPGSLSSSSVTTGTTSVLSNVQATVGGLGGGNDPKIEVLHQADLFRIRAGDQLEFPKSELYIATGQLYGYSGTPLNTAGFSFTPGISSNTAQAVIYATDGGPFSVTVAATMFGAKDTTIGTKPTCDVSSRGNRWFVAGGAGVADTYEACMKSAADTYAWVAIATNP